MRLLPTLARSAALLALAALPAFAQAPEPIGQSSPTLTPAYRVGNTVYTSGQLGMSRTDPDSSIQAQTRRTLDNIKRVIELSGTTMAHVVKCTVFLVEAADFQGMNQAYREYFPSAPPARSTVVVKALVVPGALVEIECIAAMPPK